MQDHVHNLAIKYDNIYIACGPIVSYNPKTIGYPKIAIPDAFYKALLRQKDDTWTAIGFIIPNKNEQKPLSKYVMSIDELEIITDIDFFVALPDSIEEIVESTYNLKDWDL